MSEFKVAGKGHVRLDAPDKAAGVARFGADIPANRALIGLVLRSPNAHARLVSVDARRARRIPGVCAVLTGEDCPDTRFGGDVQDQRLLARDGFVRYVGDPVAAVAAETREAARAALEAIAVRYEVLAPAVDPLAGREGRDPLLHRDWREIGLGPGGHGNLIASVEQDMGDVDKGFAEADRIFEHIFTTPFSHPAYIEPHACLAEAGADGRVTIWTSTQAPYWIRDEVAEALGLPVSRIRVIPTEVGGGFSGKIFSFIEHIAALLALRSGRPVRAEMTREEDHSTVNPRHPHHIRIRTGVMGNGTLLAREMDVTLEHGAYGRMGAYQAKSKMVMAAGSYRVPNVRVRAFAVYTNAPICGPVRAPSGPQYHFATEVHMDIIVRELGIDPLEIRRRNAVRGGDASLFGVQPDDVMPEVLERAAREGEWGAPIRAGGDLEGPGWVRGRGIACGFWSSPGGGASCTMKLNEDGTVQVVSGTVNLTGATTSLSQLAAEELGLNLDAVQFDCGDTDTAPRSIHAGGSMVTRSVGAAVLGAAASLKGKILSVAAEKLEVAPEDLVLEGGKVFARAAPERSLGLGEVAGAAPGVQGFLLGASESAAPPPCPIHTAQVAEVAVNPELGEVRVLRLTCVEDVGFAINPLSVSGQIEGAMIQGMGLALMEEQHRGPDGSLTGASFHDYLIPTSLDMPEIKTVLLDNPASDLRAPYGARPVGEPPIVATVPAIANAIYDAIGCPFFSIPIAPHHVRAAAALSRRKNGGNVK